MALSTACDRRRVTALALTTAIALIVASGAAIGPRARAATADITSIIGQPDVRPGPALSIIQHPVGLVTRGPLVYLADDRNNVIRVLDTATGEETVVAGTGVAGRTGDGGPAAAARLNAPSGVALDAEANLYIADTGNNRVRRMDAATGTMTTVAGTGEAGSNGDCNLTVTTCPAVAAQLHGPRGVAVDTSHTLFIADTDNNRVRKVTAAGAISTVAGIGQNGATGDGGPSVAAALSGPRAVLTDAGGTLFIADNGNARVRRVQANGLINTVAGGGVLGDDRPAVAASLLGAAGLAFDATRRLLIADQSSVRRVEPGSDGIITGGGGATDEIITTIPGLGAISPSDVAVADDGAILVADSGNSRVRQLDAATSPRLSTIAGSGWPDPAGVATDGAGNLFVADPDNNIIRKLDSSGRLSVVAGTGDRGFDGNDKPALQARLNAPEGIAVDATGQLLIADTGNNRIRKVDAAGNITNLAGNGDDGVGPCNEPCQADGLNGVGAPNSVVVDSSGNVVFADTAHHRIRQIDPGGFITTVAGYCIDSTGGCSKGSGGDGGPATSAGLSWPRGLAVGGSGDLFIADSGNGRVRRVHRATGIITTVAGGGSPSDGLGDGQPAISAQLNYPWGVAIDNAGTLFVSDAGAHRLRRVDAASGSIDTIAGDGTPGLSGDGGWAGNARLNVPEAVVVSASGDVVLADRGNARVRRIQGVAAASDPTPPPVGTGPDCPPGPRPGGPAPLSVSGIAPPVGPVEGGTRVTIAGSGFWSATTSVSFGELAAEQFSVVCDSIIEAVAPAQRQGVVPVLITSTTRATASWPFTYGSGTFRSCSGEDIAPTCPGPLSQARYEHTATTLDGPPCRSQAARAYCGKVLVLGGTTAFYREGSGDTGIDSAELFDPITGRWASSTPMIDRHRGHSATLLDGPQCRLTSPPPTYCGTVLVVGDSLTPERYDPATSKWTPTSAISAPRSPNGNSGIRFHTATVLDGPACRAPTDGGGDTMPEWCGDVLVAGGSRGIVGNPTNADAFLYDPGSDTWTRTAGALNESRAFHSATLMDDGKVLVAGGLKVVDTSAGGLVLGLGPKPARGTEVLNSVEVYDPASGRWALVSPMAERRFSQSASVLGGPDCDGSGRPAYCGKVLMAGGVAAADSTARTYQLMSSTELYDPAAGIGGAWSPGPLMQVERAGHTATPLADGRILVVGGGMSFEIHDYAPSAYHPVALVELFDPARGLWTYGPSLGWARGVHTATPLDGRECQGAAPAEHCGSILIVGGAGAPGTGDAPPAVDASELYTPTPVVGAVEPSAGPAEGGTAVVVRGHGFTRDSEVRFGTTLATVTDVTSSQIGAVSPAHVKGRVDITIAGPGGSSAAQSVNLAARFTYRGSPGAVSDLAAVAASPSEINLAFSAPDDGTAVTPAARYSVRQSLAPITNDAEFEAATPLCRQGVCDDFAPGEIGAALTLRVGDLDAGTTYYYRLRAVGEPGVGPISNSASATTLGTAPPPRASCPGAGAGGPRRVVYPTGYSLIGVPGGVQVSTNAPLYGWFDLGSGGSYSVIDPAGGPVSGRGYWAWFRCPTAVDVSRGEDSAVFPLAPYHASMVGNPSGLTPVVVTGQDFAARWDPAANDGFGGYRVSAYREAQMLAIGGGTWVFSYADSSIAIGP